MKNYSETEYSVEENIKGRLFEDVKEITSYDPGWDRLDGKKILITGAGGFISFYLVSSLLLRNDTKSAGITVIGLVRNKKRAEEKYGKLAEREDLMLVEQDVCSHFEIEEKADYVIHAASQASAWHFENDPVGTIRANLVGTDNALMYAKESGAVFLLVSSLKVYGDVTNGSKELVEETQGFVDPDSYKNCYAVGKRAAETLSASYAKQYGMSVKIVRPSYIYGAASLDDDRVWAQFIANIVRGESILLKSSGAPYRSFCYVTDTARAILKVLVSGENMQPYNISGEAGNVTIRGFAKKAVEAFPERGLTLSFANKEDEAEPVQDYSKKTPEIMSPEKLEALGWKAQVDISEGIKRAVAILEEK